MNNLYHIRIDRGPGESLHVQVRYPTKTEKLCTIIFVHGFLGDGIENHRMFIRMSDCMNSLGYICVLFDQYGCGYSDGDYQTVRLNDVKCDLEDVTAWAISKLGGKVGYICQSLGSAICLSMPQDDLTAFKVAINPAANFDKWLVKRYGWDLSSTNDLFCAKPKGIYVSRKYIIDLINWRWIEDLKDSEIPTLIIAGTNDDINSMENAKIAKRKLGKKAEIKFIHGANHSFVGQRELEQEVTQAIKAWLKRTDT